MPSRRTLQLFFAVACFAHWCEVGQSQAPQQPPPAVAADTPKSVDDPAVLRARIKAVGSVVKKLQVKIAELELRIRTLEKAAEAKQ